MNFHINYLEQVFLHYTFWTSLEYLSIYSPDCCWHLPINFMPCFTPKEGRNNMVLGHKSSPTCPLHLLWNSCTCTLDNTCTPLSKSRSIHVYKCENAKWYLMLNSQVQVDLLEVNKTKSNFKWWIKCFFSYHFFPIFQKINWENFGNFLF